MRLLQNVLLALGSLLVFVAASEGLSRLRHRPERVRYGGIFEYDRDKVWTLKGNLTDGVFVGLPVRTNSFGHRDREIPLRKPANAFRVVAAGDSVTFGHGVAAEQAWPERLELRLAARHPGHAVDVINTAVPGNTTFQEYFDLERALAFGPDAAVIQFVVNDVIEPYRVLRRYGGRGRDYHGVDDVPYWDWLLSQHSAFYLLLKRDVAPRLRFGALTTEGVRQAALREEAKLSWQAGADEPTDPRVVEAWRECLRWMLRAFDLCRRRGVPLVLLATPEDFQLEDETRTYAQRRLAALAAEHDVAFVDLLTTLRERVAAERPRDPDAGRAVWRRYFLDHDHLTPAGHELVAEVLEPVLDRIAPADRTSGTSRGCPGPDRLLDDVMALAKGRIGTNRCAPWRLRRPSA